MLSAMAGQVRYRGAQVRTLLRPPLASVVPQPRRLVMGLQRHATNCNVTGVEGLEAQEPPFGNDSAHAQGQALPKAGDGPGQGRVDRADNSSTAGVKVFKGYREKGACQQFRGRAGDPT